MSAEIAKAKELAAKQAAGGAKEDEKKQKAAAAEEMRKTMLLAILSPEAKERLARIACVKADKARKLEDMLLGAAKAGAIKGQVSEATLVSYLEKISEAEPQIKVSFERREECDIDLDNL